MSYNYGPLWLENRQKRLELDKHQCRACDLPCDKTDLEVHHRTTDYSAENLARQGVDDLITLCKWCHDAITDSRRKRREKKDPELGNYSHFKPIIERATNGNVQDPKIETYRHSTPPLS